MRSLLLLAALTTAFSLRAQAQPLMPPEKERDRFLAIERIARLAPEDQKAQVKALYSDLAASLMNPFVEGIISSIRSDIFDPKSFRGPGGGTDDWARQIQDAAKTLTPEQVADKIDSLMWLRVGARARAIQVFKAHQPAVSALIADDLKAADKASVDRACSAIQTLKLTDFRDQLLALHRGNTPSSQPAQLTLMFTPDPQLLAPLLADVEKDPAMVIRHSSLIQTCTNGGKASPIIVALLASDNRDIRRHAAYAVLECHDATLAPHIAKLAKDADMEVRWSAAYMARHLPPVAYKSAQPSLAPLLQDPELKVRLQAITAFAAQKDLLAAPALLALMQRDTIDPGGAVQIMQALHALTGDRFNYNMHEWGPKRNADAIKAFRKWIEDHASFSGLPPHAAMRVA